FGPSGLRELVEQNARLSGVIFPYTLEIVEVQTEVVERVFENKLVEVSTIPLAHRAPCVGWLFREKPKLLNIRKEMIDAYQIPVGMIPGIKAGAGLHLPDGRFVPNSELTKPPRPAKAFAFCSDTAPSEAVVDAVRGVDLLYHEATFTEEHTEEARLSFHSTAAQAAGVARRARVKQLLLGHFSGRYTDLDRHLAEARGVFSATVAAEEGKVYSVG
ncbi:MAG: ribonuclease, partial [Saprospiraceae bacterium]|nr:ribonuclease [Saprospiraceae bacterium]